MVYADTSVIVALLTPEPATGTVTAWFSGLKKTPVSSDWLLTEFSSAISIKLRAGQITEAHAKAIHLEFQSLLSGGLRLAPISRTAFQAAANAAQAYKSGLRAGDSLHLAVAQEIGVKTIATLDETMAKNAKRLKMATVQF